MISLISDFVYSELPDITLISPMWLNKYTVDIIKIDAFFGASYRFKPVQILIVLIPKLKLYRF